jgi:ABC-type phosphate/phosphonate transport system substrate-binding protein
MAQNFSNDELRDGFSAQRNQSDHLVLVVRKGSTIQNFADLAGKRLSLLSGDELSDVYLETQLMKVWGKPDEARLASVTRQKRSSALVHDLFFGRTDAVFVRRNSLEAAATLNPQILQQLVVLEDYTFKGKVPNIGFFSTRITPEQAETVTRAVLTLGDSARGKQVLEIYHADAMVRTSYKDLDAFRELLSQHRALKAVAGIAQKKGAR